MSFDRFSDIFDRRERRPAGLRRPIVAIGAIWLLFGSAFLVIIPATRTDAGAVARTAVFSLGVAVWWWSWDEVLDRVRLRLGAHPELGDWKRILAYIVALVAYPALSLAVFVIAAR